ncbi:hypothetical protein [Streptomyces collinus]|uniref:hypothetical protein n=1 Tax=Streptomyces collinus TaxID=42684 RepID=UPI0033F67F00
MAERGSGRWWRTHSIRGFFAAAVILVLVCGGLFVFFVKGLYLLPDKVCEGSVQRDVVIRTLPRARAADEWSDHRGRGTDFMFGCRVSTSGDSILSGSVNLRESSKDAWERFYGGDAGTRVVRTSAGRVAALAQLDDDGVASVYVPCEPKDAGGASGPRALVADVDVIGKSRASRGDRRQDLTDFAYQLTRHAYALAGCKGPSDFPGQLPRYEDH